MTLSLNICASQIVHYSVDFLLLGSFTKDKILNVEFHSNYERSQFDNMGPYGQSVFKSLLLLHL